MKERPIIFNDEMVRTVLSGAKTQTRRVIKPQPKVSDADVKWVSEAWDSGYIEARCPYGKPGDRLWVQEAFTLIDSGQDMNDLLIYRADAAKYFVMPDRSKARVLDRPLEPQGGFSRPLGFHQRQAWLRMGREPLGLGGRV